MPGATITVGNVEITAVHDNEGALPLSMVFPGVDAELWVPYQQKYPECFNGDNNENFAAHLSSARGGTSLRNLPTRTPSKSWPVTTASTPGNLSALEISMLTILA